MDLPRVRKKGSGGARPGSGRPKLEATIAKEQRRLERVNAEEIEKDYIDGSARGALINLMSDGDIQPIDIMYKTMRHYDRMADEAAELRDETPDDDENKAARDILDRTAGEFLEKSAKTAEKLLPFIHPKLANIEHSGNAPAQQVNVGQINVFLKSTIDRLAAGSGARRDFLENVAGGAGGAAVRLGLLEPAGAAGAEVQPEQQGRIVANVVVDGGAGLREDPHGG